MIDEDDFSGTVFNGDVTVNIEDLELLEDATVRGNLTITGGTIDSDLTLLGVLVEGDLDLTGFEGEVDYTNSTVIGDTYQ